MKVMKKYIVHSREIHFFARFTETYDLTNGN